MSFLAPQAYTKETLAMAFDWLQYQPATIREAATTPDVLVSLYMRAQRHGITTAKRDAKISSTQFLKELKGLKEDIEVFETPIDQTQTSVSVEQISSQATDSQVNIEQLKSTTTEVTTQSTLQTLSKPAMSTHDINNIDLDERSNQSLESTMKRLNLTHKNEAMRLLIALGEEALNSLHK